MHTIQFANVFRFEEPLRTKIWICKRQAVATFDGWKPLFSILEHSKTKIEQNHWKQWISMFECDCCFSFANKKLHKKALQSTNNLRIIFFDYMPFKSHSSKKYILGKGNETPICLNFIINYSILANSIYWSNYIYQHKWL